MDQTTTPGPGPHPSDRWCDGFLHWIDANRRWLLALTLLAYLAGFNGQWRIEPDSALYLSVARNLAEGHGYSYQGTPHRLAYPGLPYLLAGVFKIGGVDNLRLANGLMLAIGLATLALVYRLFYLHAGRAVAVLMTLGVGWSKLFFAYSFYLMTDMPFLLGVMSLLAGYEAVFHRTQSRWSKRQWVGNWILLVAGLALTIVTRPVMIGLIGAILLAFGWAIFRGTLHKRRLALAATAVLAIVGFFLLDPRRTRQRAMGEYENQVISHFSNITTLLHQQLWANAKALFESKIVRAYIATPLLPGLNTLLAGWIIAVSLGLSRRRVLWGAWVAVTLLMMATIFPEERYFLPILPLMIYGGWRGMCWLNHRLPSHWGNLVFMLLLLLATVPNAVKVVNFIVEQHNHFSTKYKAGRYVPVRYMCRWMEHNLPSGAVVLTPYKLGRIVSYQSRRDTFEAAEAMAAEADGWPLLVLWQAGDVRLAESVAYYHLRLGPPIHEEIWPGQPPLELRPVLGGQASP